MKKPAGPYRIIDTILGYRAAKILFVAATFDVFTLLNGGARTLEAVASSIKTDLRATRILLDALVPLGFLRKKGGRYSNTSVSDTFLVKGKPGYMGHNLKYQELIWDSWSDLRHILKKGRTGRPLENRLSGDESFSKEYIHGMANIARVPAGQISSLISNGRLETMLDVGAGPGSYALAFLEKNPRLHAWLLDLPTTLKITRGIVSSHPASKRVHFIPGNYHTVDFGKDRFDIVLMSHITHDEGEKENLLLLKKAYRSLKPGGRVLIHDFVVDRSRTEPRFGALFAVHMLVYTKNGRVYTPEEYGAWMKSAGFKNIRTFEINKESRNGSMCLSASKPIR